MIVLPNGRSTNTGITSVMECTEKTQTSNLNAKMEVMEVETNVAHTWLHHDHASKNKVYGLTL